MSYKELEATRFNMNLCGFPEKEEVVLSPEEVMNQYYHERKALEESLSRASAALKNFIDGEKTELFSIKSVIERIAVLDKAFPENIKKSILQAALQGKMTERKEGDSNAMSFSLQVVLLS